MINLGLSAPRKRTMEAIMVNHHWVHVRLQVLDLNHNALSDISDRLLGGQVNIDASEAVTRSLELDLMDPFFTLSLDSNSPDAGALFADRMVRVIVTVQTPDRTDSFDVPLFCGPVTKIDRNGPTVKVECMGKETLAMSNLWRGRTFKKHTPFTTLIRRILVDLGGEKKIDIPAKKATNPREISLNRETSPWLAAKNFARALNMQLFYDGRGVARLRTIPAYSVFAFTDQNASLMSDVQASHETLDQAVNAVQVIGAKPKGAKDHVSATVVADRNHPLSPWKLGRFNADGDFVPRFLPKIIRDDKIKTNKDAKIVANRELRLGLLRGVEVTFDALPIFHLEEMDVCRIHSEQYSGDFRFMRASIPLTNDGIMSVGYLRRVTPNARSIRVRRRRSA